MNERCTGISYIRRFNPNGYTKQFSSDKQAPIFNLSATMLAFVQLVMSFQRRTFFYISQSERKIAHTFTVLILPRSSSYYMIISYFYLNASFNLQMFYVNFFLLSSCVRMSLVLLETLP